jgi:hypothetical protein
VRDRGGGQPIAVVAHVHGQPRAALAVWLEAGRHSHGEGAMTQGIADEVGNDNVEAAAVQPNGQPGGHVSGYVRPVPRAKAPAHDGRDVASADEALIPKWPVERGRRFVGKSGGAWQAD